MSTFIPLSEIPSSFEYDEAESPVRMSWDFEMPPHLDLDRIGIDAGQLRRLQAVGAFAANHVKSFQGETTRYEPQVAGMDEGGNAIASFRVSTIKKADGPKTKLKDPYSKFIMVTHGKTSAVHKLNKAELARIVTEEHNSRIDQHQRWANALDDSLQASVRKAAFEHLIDRVSIPRAIIADGLVNYDVALSVLFGLMPDGDGKIDASDNIPYGIIGTTMTRAVLEALTARRAIGAENMSLKQALIERRWSLSYAFQPDRYLAVNALTRINSLVKARK